MANDSFSEVSAPLLPKGSSSEDDKQQSTKAEDVNQPKTVLEFEEIGVWTIMREVDLKASWKLPVHSVATQAKEIMTVLPITIRFLQECFSVSPWMMAVYLLSSFWSSLEDAIGLYFSSRLLNIIQQAVTSHKVDGHALARAVISNILFTLMSTMIKKNSKGISHTLANRVRYLFEERLIQANLRLDLPTFEEPETAAKINRYFAHGSRGGAWEIFVDLVSKLHSLSSVVSQLAFIFGALRSQPGGFWFAMVCLGKSLYVSISYDSLWSQTAYVWDSNPHYRRMRALVGMVTDSKHRIEIISDGLPNYIHREWKKARILLGDTSDDYPDSLLRLRRSNFLSFLDAIQDDLPLIFYAFQVYLSPQNFSLASIALIQQTSQSLTWTFYHLFKDDKSFLQRLHEIKTISELGNIRNQVKDGELRYPAEALKPSSGMEVKFQNVSFAYPKGENVIKDVSFTIGKGQAVVIVGINGSGKSTLLKLLNRLYDPTTGTISIDGTPFTSFVGSDVRRSMAMLTQNYTHYPLSVRENIAMGLGDADYSSDYEEDEKRQLSCDGRVREAARLGGAAEIIEKQPNGFDGVLKPSVYAYAMSSSAAGEDFENKMKEITKQADISSGQWQRLALSRLFFRAVGQHTRLVAVDEPSASLDPKMEYELFESLRASSTAQGKTMVFVTHRFGYLTKRADLILVMQNGCLVEQGKHSDLLELGGEYAKLYKLQAEAFLPDEEKK